MTQLRQESDKLAQLNIEVIIVGPEDADAFKKYWQKESLSFIGLPDPDHSVMNLYGQEVKILKLGRMPAQMLIDKAGILKFIHYGNSMSDIPDIGGIATALNSSNE